MSLPLRIAFAGDRQISVDVLDFLLGQGVTPQALITAAPNRASHADALIDRCGHLPEHLIFRGTEFRTEAGLRALDALELDYVISIHLPYLVPAAALALPRHGWLNLHPSFLPFNRGWHTATWAILDGTPAGATLHVMDDSIDTGDIIRQRRVEIRDSDTAHTLYNRILRAEYEVFCEVWPEIAANGITAMPQGPGAGSTHRRIDLEQSGLKEIDADRAYPASDLILQLRALTTNSAMDAATIELGGRRYAVQVTLTPLDEPE